MKIEVDTKGVVVKEVYSGILLETSEGNQIGICMRDDTFEINVLPKENMEKNKWFRVDMQKRTIIDESRFLKEAETNEENCDSPGIPYYKKRVESDPEFPIEFARKIGAIFDDKEGDDDE